MVVTRFAPSPTGLLHLGHARAALLAWQAARAASGRFLLRIEDIDATRCRPEFVAAILADLTWLGLEWDGEVRVQSDHLPQYRSMLDVLHGRGLLYPCFCSRADIARAGSAPHTPDGSAVYPGTCRHLSAAEQASRIGAGLPHAWRLDMGRAFDRIACPLTFQEAGQGTIVCNPRPFGDVVLARKDLPASYHLCVVHDDARQGVTLVTRGSDLLPATHVHRLLQHLLELPVPRYAHHDLLTDVLGRRLAKRDGALSLRSLRESGISAADARGRALAPGSTSG